MLRCHPEMIHPAFGRPFPYKKELRSLRQRVLFFSPRMAEMNHFSLGVPEFKDELDEQESRQFGFSIENHEEPIILPKFAFPPMQ
jgi:hypothetical protein